MENIKTFRIGAKLVQKDNQKFTSCTAKINGKWYHIKFTQTCETSPKDRGVYELQVNLKDCSFQRGKVYTSKKGVTGVDNDTLWIKHVINLRRIPDDELDRENAEKLASLFDGKPTDDEPLPF